MSKMYFPIHLILILFSFCTLQAQERVLTHSRAKVMLGNQDLMNLAAAGIDITHGYYEKDCCFSSDFSNVEIEKMREKGFEVLIEIEDVALHYQMQNLFPKETKLVSRSSPCDQNKIDRYPIPNNFELGSMGGFHTYAEIMDILDLMHILYPHLISLRKPIGDYKTYFGRPIYFVKISNAPDEDQVNKPKVLHTALHHAREPISVSQLLYFMWYLLENYDKDPNVKGLVDAVELYLVPVINVDGYIFNEQNFPSGGGMHRKNRRVLAMGNIGVDLNRNYDYQWGFDEIGSSPEDWSDVYRGPSPASEPEVKAIKYLCGEKGFDIAFNHHSYGNALLYPFGYAEVAVPDQETFFSLSSEMTSQNAYEFGRPWEVQAVGYRTNGSSDDWMYGENLSKPPIFAFTPEIGAQNQGFWPHRDDILSLCQSTLHMNISSLTLVNTYGSITEMTPELIGDMDDQLLFKLKRTGLKDGSYNIKVKALSSNVTMTMSERTHQLLPNASLETAFKFELSNDISIGESVRFASELTMGDIVLRDTIEKIYMGEKSIRFSDTGLTMDNWSTGVSHWGIDETDYFTPSTSISDSPAENYQPQSNNTMRLFQGIDLRDADAAFLTFRAKWAIEPSADYLTISASENGFVFQPLCGKFTKPSNLINIQGTPVYDGFKSDWVLEVMDLQDYIGGNLFLELTLSSDQSREFDGFYIDDIQIVTFDGTSNTQKQTIEQISSRAYPNPASNKLFFELDHKITNNQSSTKLELYNMLGELVSKVPFSDLSTKVLEMDVEFLSAGFYVYRIVAQDQLISTGRVSIVK